MARLAISTRSSTALAPALLVIVRDGVRHVCQISTDPIVAWSIKAPFTIFPRCITEVSFFGTGVLCSLRTETGHKWPSNCLVEKVALGSAFVFFVGGPAVVPACRAFRV